MDAEAIESSQNTAFSKSCRVICMFFCVKLLILFFRKSVHISSSACSADYVNKRRPRHGDAREARSAAVSFATTAHLLHGPAKLILVAIA